MSQAVISQHAFFFQHKHELILTTKSFCVTWSINNPEAHSYRHSEPWTLYIWDSLVKSGTVLGVWDRYKPAEDGLMHFKLKELLNWRSSFRWGQIFAALRWSFVVPVFVIVKCFLTKVCGTVLWYEQYFRSAENFILAFVIWRFYSTTALFVY